MSLSHFCCHGTGLENLQGIGSLVLCLGESCRRSMTSVNFELFHRSILFYSTLILLNDEQLFFYFSADRNFTLVCNRIVTTTTTSTTSTTSSSTSTGIGIGTTTAHPTTVTRPSKINSQSTTTQSERTTSLGLPSSTVPIDKTGQPERRKPNQGLGIGLFESLWIAVFHNFLVIHWINKAWVLSICRLSSWV